MREDWTRRDLFKSAVASVAGAVLSPRLSALADSTTESKRPMPAGRRFRSGAVE